MLSMRFYSVLVASCTVLLSACSTVGTPKTSLSSTKKGLQTVPTDFDVSLQINGRHEKTLTNGLKVIVKEDHRAPVVMTQVWYKVGSTDEPDGKGGISHLLEHMMFKGTKKVSGDDFARIVSRYGGQHNAFTSHDYTGYYQFYPTKRLNLALELEADRMRNLVLTKKDFVAERQVVMEERRQRTDDVPKSLAYEQFRQLAYSTASQRKPVIGSMTDIESISLQDLKNWYDQWYQPNNATVVIVGDVTAEEAFSQVEKYFATIPKKTSPKRLTVIEPQLQGKRHQKLNSTVPVPVLYMSFNVPSLRTSLISQKSNKPDANNEAYALALLADVLDGGLSARLESRLVREKKILAQVGTSYDLFARGDGLFFISATPNKGVTMEQAEQAILAEINELKNQPILQSEINRAKVNYVTNIIYQQDSVASQARMIALLATLGLDDRMIAELPKHIGNISENRLQQIATKYFNEKNYASFYVLPEAK